MAIHLRFVQLFQSGPKRSTDRQTAPSPTQKRLHTSLLMHVSALTPLEWFYIELFCHHYRNNVTWTRITGSSGLKIVNYNHHTGPCTLPLCLTYLSPTAVLTGCSPDPLLVCRSLEASLTLAVKGLRACCVRAWGRAVRLFSGGRVCVHARSLLVMYHSHGAWLLWSALQLLRSVIRVA